MPLCFTRRAAAAGEKTTVATGFYHHRRLALVADLIRLDRALLFERLGVFALGIPWASEKTTVAPPLDDHHALAFFALYVRLLLQREFELFATLVGTGQIIFPRIIELLYRRHPIVIPLLDPIELILHIGREIHIEEVWKGVNQ